MFFNLPFDGSIEFCEILIAKAERLGGVLSEGIEYITEIQRNCAGVIFSKKGLIFYIRGSMEAFPLDVLRHSVSKKRR